LGHGQAALLRFLLEHLLLVLETEELFAVFKQRLQELLILGVLYELEQLLWDVAVHVVLLFAHLVCHVLYER